MEKPFVIMKNELVEKIVTAINKSELDMGVIELILQNIMREVSMIAERDAKEKMNEWAGHMAQAEGIAPEGWTPPPPFVPNADEDTEPEDDDSVEDAEFAEVTE